MNNDVKITPDNLRFFLLDFDQHELRKKLQKQREEYGHCEYCGRQTGTEDWHQSLTCYPWNMLLQLEDPNREHFLCDECAKEDQRYWEEMWRDYNSSRF